MSKKKPFPGLSARFKAIRKYFGWTQAAMAAAMDTSQALVSAIELGKRDPPKHTLYRLKELGVDSIWLLSGIGTMMLRTGGLKEPDMVKDAPRLSEFRSLPILGYVPAGYPGPSPVEEALDGYFPMPTRDIPDPDAFMLRVQTDSMTGIVEPGDLVAVSPMLRARLKPNDLVVVRIEPDDTLVKRYIRTEQSVVFLSTNPKVRPIVVAGTDERTVTVIGKVTHIIHRQP